MVACASWGAGRSYRAGGGHGRGARCARRVARLPYWMAVAAAARRSAPRIPSLSQGCGILTTTTTTTTSHHTQATARLHARARGAWQSLHYRTAPPCWARNHAKSGAAIMVCVGLCAANACMGHPRPPAAISHAHLQAQQLQAAAADAPRGAPRTRAACAGLRNTLCSVCMCLNVP